MVKEHTDLEAAGLAQAFESHTLLSIFLWQCSNILSILAEMIRPKIWSW